jgi:hypothetical protein
VQKSASVLAKHLAIYTRELHGKDEDKTRKHAEYQNMCSDIRQSPSFPCYRPKHAETQDLMASQRK